MEIGWDSFGSVYLLLSAIASVYTVDSLDGHLQNGHLELVPVFLYSLSIRRTALLGEHLVPVPKVSVIERVFRKSVLLRDAGPKTIFNLALMYSRSTQALKNILVSNISLCSLTVFKHLERTLRTTVRSNKLLR